VVFHIPASCPKNGGGYARLVNDLRNASLKTLHERLRLAFLFAWPQNRGGDAIRIKLRPATAG